MDTIHDLGGREGFGPVRWQEDDDSRLFHEPWQARTWAISMMMMGRLEKDQTGWTLDWHRHVLERMAPADYLSMNYFDKWIQSMMATLIDDGVAEVEEFVEGHSRSEPPRRALRPLAAGDALGLARFVVGQSVVTKRSMSSMHTRLPGYARGHKGVIESCLGPKALPDASAVGDLRKEQLYTVRFEGAELWPETQGNRTHVFIDLWECYLEPA